MRITSGVVLTLVLSLSALAQQRTQPIDGFPDTPELDVIIELAEPPVLEGRASAARIDALLAQLETDVSRIEGRTRGPKNNAAAEPVLHDRYRVVYSGASAHIGRDNLAAIRALPYVKAVHPDTQVQAHLATSVPLINAPKVWEQYGVRGKGVVVAIIDTGIDYRHKSLGKGLGPQFKVLGGWDFVNDDDDPMDDSGHGTHVAGIVAGNAAPVIGVAPDASLLAYKVLNHEGKGKSSDVLAGVERAIDPNGDGDPADHAHVVNMSLGGPLTLNDPTVAAVERGVREGVVFTISAGNNSLNGTFGSPAIAPSAITVGATFSAGDKYADFSSRGPVGGTWLAKPEIAAPGVEIVSAKVGGGTMAATGTSMAAPHVAGVAALILEKHPSWSPQEVKSAIVSTAAPVVSPDDPSLPRVLSAGGGRIDAKRAIDATILPSPATLSFGIVTMRNDLWSAARIVRLTNRGNEPETITFKGRKLPNGADLTITPETITIPRGAWAEVTVTLELGRMRADPPPPNEDEIAFTGVLEMTGERSSLHLPWVAVNGKVLSATFAGNDKLSWQLIERNTNPVSWPEGPRTIGAFLRDDVDIVALFEPEGAEPRLVVREALPVSGYTPVTISPDEAIHKVDVAAVDDHGVPFASGITVTRELLLRDWNRISLPDADREQAWMVSPLATTQLRTFEFVTSEGSRYMTMYPILPGLHGDERLEVRASDWASQTISHNCATRCAAFLAPAVGVFSWSGWKPLDAGLRTWKLFLTPKVSNESDFRALVGIREEDVPEAWRFTYLSPAMRNEGGRITVSPFERTTPADYVSPSAQKPVVIGDGPVVLRTAMSKRRVDFAPAGAALGESIDAGTLAIQASLFDLAGNEIFIGQRGNGSFSLPNENGAYRLIATDSYRVSGRPGLLTQISVYDKAKHFAAPTLTMLRVEDAIGAAVTSLPAYSRARLFFAARHTSYEEEAYVFHQPIDPAATRVWWRVHGTREWLPLPVSVTGSDYRFRGSMPGTAGTMYEGDLQAATWTEGTVDLRILVANRYGGTTEATYEPAFVVLPGDGKRRAVH